MDTTTWDLAVEVIEVFDRNEATMRAIEPRDAEALTRFHAQLSPSTIRMRFFNLHRELSAAEVERFTQVDGCDRVAFVIVIDDEIIAVGRYDRLEVPDTAELAFVVADVYQHHGLGKVLLKALAARAREVGITTLYAETLAENRAMLGLLRDTAFPMRTRTSWGVVDVSLDISGATSDA